MRGVTENRTAPKAWHAGDIWRILGLGSRALSSGSGRATLRRNPVPGEGSARPIDDTLSRVPQKLRYEIDLSGLTPVAATHDLNVRSISRDDLEGLAGLMLDAYVGTIDYEDETLDDAIGEVRSFMDDDSSLLDRSYLIEDDGTIASAVLVSVSEGRPFIGYVMTRPSHKKHGLARLVTITALECLAGDGHETVVLYTTEGNTPSEALFRSIGAVQVGS